MAETAATVRGARRGKRLAVWGRRAALGGFWFFLAKGLVWLGFGAAVVGGCVTE